MSLWPAFYEFQRDINRRFGEFDGNLRGMDGGRGGGGHHHRRDSNLFRFDDDDLLDINIPALLSVPSMMDDDWMTPTTWGNRFNQPQQPMIETSKNRKKKNGTNKDEETKYDGGENNDKDVPIDDQSGPTVSPQSQQQQLQTTGNQLLNRTPFTNGWMMPQLRTLSARVNVEDQKDKVVVTAELPGFDKADIKVNVTDDGLLHLSAEHKQEQVNESKDKRYVRAERHFANIQRTLRVPPTVDTTNIKANYENGILHLDLPKREIRSAGQQVPIA